MSFNKFLIISESVHPKEGKSFCKICEKRLYQEGANYCSSKCKDVHFKIGIFRYTGIFFTILTVVIFIISAQTGIINTNVLFIITMISLLLVIYPLFQFSSYYKQIATDLKNKQLRKVLQSKYDDKPYHSDKFITFLYINRTQDWNLFEFDEDDE